MRKTLTRRGNSLALILDKPVLELLKIAQETVLDISTNGTTLTITPIRDTSVHDLTEFTLESLPLTASTTLVFDPPLVLVPELSDCKQYLTIENADFGIDVIAQTRDELWEEVAAVVRHLWQFCAKEHDEKLGHLFIKTKRNDIENGLERKCFVLRVEGDHRFLDFELGGKRHFLSRSQAGVWNFVLI